MVNFAGNNDYQPEVAANCMDLRKRIQVENKKPFTLDRLAGVFIMFCIGCGLAFAAFVLEWIIQLISSITNNNRK